MNIDLQKADSRALHEPFCEQLDGRAPKAALAWLMGVLASQSPALRSSNSNLVAYTGCVQAIDWLEANVDSPVSEHWGQGAALLGTPWPRIKIWLSQDGPCQLMALDALVAYRAPAPNMSPLAQIAAPVLPAPPEFGEYQAVLNGVIGDRSTPRIKRTVATALRLGNEILSRNQRGVSVADLPLLYLRPEQFENASEILSRHDEVRSGVRKSIQDLLARFGTQS